MAEQKSLSENQLKRAAATAGLIAGAGAIIGSVLTYLAIRGNIETYVAQAYEAEAKKARTLSVTMPKTTPVMPSESYTKNEEFKADTPQGDLASKVGFAYEVDERECQRNNPGIFDDSCYGTMYNFTIKKFLGDIEQHLMVTYFTGGLFHSSIVSISDKDADNIPDYISIGDGKTDLRVVIARNSDGVLEYEFVNEQGAKELFDAYTALYQDFKKKENIDERIAAYQQRIVVGPIEETEVKP